MNKMGFLIFFAIYISINFYIFFRGRQALPKEILVQAIYSILFWIFSLSIFVAFTLEGKLHPAIIAIADNLGGFWVVTFLFFLVMILVADIFRLTDYFLGIFPLQMKENWSQVKIIYLCSVVFMWLTFSIIGYLRFSNPKIVNLNLDLPAKGNHHSSLNIVAASDIHLGNVIRKGRLIKYVKLINDQNPDIILLAGDLFDRNLHTVEWQQMDAELSKLKAKFGVYAILGNHEYYGNLNKAMEIISRSGIMLLKDTTVTIDSAFVLIGRDDRTNRMRKPLKSVIQNIDRDLPSILLDHQPYHLKEAVENKINLQISGHTHNGQLFPINRIVAKMYELAYGYSKIGNTHFYVSSGLGLWGAPIRLGTQSEIVKIKLNFVDVKAIK